MAFVRILSTLAKDKKIGKSIVPIVPDEARTFGMEGMFRQLGIYSAEGQKYTPEDADEIMFYKEDKSGQILEEGINEVGSMSSCCRCDVLQQPQDADGTFHIYYSMFGHQRIGDLAWLAGDAQARGFPIGGTAGRTTLNGEGLQHQDGHSHVLQPCQLPYLRPDLCLRDGGYRPRWPASYVQRERERLLLHHRDERKLRSPGYAGRCGRGHHKGMYKLKADSSKKKLRVNLMGAGTILRIEAAAEILANDYNVAADVWSVTSVNELTRDGQAAERVNMLNPEQEPKKAYVTEQLRVCRAPNHYCD